MVLRTMLEPKRAEVRDRKKTVLRRASEFLLLANYYSNEYIGEGVMGGDCVTYGLKG